MRYYSTRDKNQAASFAVAALAGLAPDGGLYIPEEIPRYSAAAKASLGSMAYTDIAFETIRPWVEKDIPGPILQEMIHSAYPFAAPLVKAGDRLVLELFHGPTAAFKDFGARFMARAFSYLRRGEEKPLKILVATSGDTGGAVADGFYKVEGISVTVLYPKGRVSPLQERQIAGLKENICALAVDGSFDDCQRLVKQAFGDSDLNKRMVLSSANSINISRLIPQAVYYAAGAGKASDVVFSVPSGNFGNLTAGLYAWKMGAPIKRFIAAANINKTVPDYLESGNYEPRPSHATLSNAMDVGAPSNFERIAAHFSWQELRQLVLGASVTDNETRDTISEVHSRWGYYLDPHTAVGWRAASTLKEAGLLAGESALGILSTAHPAKFAETVEPITGPVPVPLSLQKAMQRSVQVQTIPAELEALKECL
ncbi:MAG: threonine synthase [Treponema sp.]|nr:threonine synthase [Treponema sp.]